MERNLAIDVTKGVGIIAVIVGHMVSTGNWLFSFHMPLFFIFAGYFFRPRDIGATLKKDARRLLVPYVVTAFAVVAGWALLAMRDGEGFHLSWLVAAVYGCGSALHTSRFFSQVPLIGAIWFLLALFWCKTFFNVVYQASPKSRWLAVVVWGTSAGAILLDTYVVNFPLAVLPGLGGVFFYWIGFQLKHLDLLGRFRWWVEVPLYAAWLAAALFSAMSMARCYYECFPLDVLGACGGTLLAYRISHLIAKCPGLGNLFAWTGQNSLLILCVHLFDLDVRFLKAVGCPRPGRAYTEIAFCLLAAALLNLIPPVRRIFKP